MEALDTARLQLNALNRTDHIVFMAIMVHDYQSALPFRIIHALGNLRTESLLICFGPSLNTE